MEKVSSTRVAAAAVVALCLLLAPAQEAAGVEYMTYPPNMINCKVLGNCEKNAGPEATRPGKPANSYTRGCSAIDRCRG
ncbi:uncharacterized protein LOC120710457 [Panicum virgatum]|uniref:Uncharacterized protein n=1 Tax=Panicum virgatum TaxID=38727 RepID=A0A8T0S8P4_PANVG|nr:uncharacterized protein LOC120710457 [Panicum virgatum]KAG2595512.1 hypothetical protein PVAP13_5KG079800 [Panicum virgatum]